MLMTTSIMVDALAQFLISKRVVTEQSGWGRATASISSDRIVLK